MKRLLPILLSVFLLTACPQAGQVLGPSNANVTASGGGAGDSSSADSPEASAPPSSTDTVAASNPIEPKADSHSIDDNGDEDSALARLGYKNEFKTLLVPDAPETLPAPNGVVRFLARAEVRATPQDPWEESKGCYVRMVYRPSDATVPLQYCDTAVFDESLPSGANVLFKGVPSGEGSVAFYHLLPSCEDSYNKLKLTFSDHIATCDAGWQTLESESSLKFLWFYMGSLKSTGPILKPATSPETSSTPHFIHIGP